MSKLLVIRGNSGSGKSTIAENIKESSEDAHIVAQDDYVKYTIPNGTVEQEHERKTRIFNAVHKALGSHALVIMEGVFDSRRYREYLDELHRTYSENSTFVYLDVPFEETLLRHQQREKRHEFGQDAMAGWYIAGDALGYESEIHINTETTAKEATLAILKVLRDGNV